MTINFTLIIVATIVQFVLGALWYSPLIFGNVWMNIMKDGGTCTKEEMEKMQKELIPFYFLQLFLTLITTWVLANNIAYANVTGAAVYYYAGFMWLGYMMPVSVSSVVWANTKKKYWAKQIAVMVGGQFIFLMVAAFILSL